MKRLMWLLMAVAMLVTGVAVCAEEQEGRGGFGGGPDGGREGGVEEKVLPALERGIGVILIERPEKA